MKCSFLKPTLLITLVIPFTGFMLSGCDNNKKTASIKRDKIYVANEEGGSVSVINPQDSLQNTNIDIKDSSGKMFMAHNVQVAPNGKSVWVTAVPMDNIGMNQLVVIDPSTNTVKKRIMLGKDLHVANVVLDNDSKYAFVTAKESSQVIQVDASNFNVIPTFDLGTGQSPHGLRYFNGKLYVANMGSKSISVINILDNTITDIPLAGVVVQTAVTPDGKFVFASLYDTKEMVRYDLQSGQIQRIPLPNDAQGPI